MTQNLPEVATGSRLKVGILIFDQVEVLDFCGPFEVFATASIASESAGQERCYETMIIAEEVKQISCRGGLLVIPHHDFASCPQLDVLVVPGGYGTRTEIHNLVVIEWLKMQRTRTSLITSVCTGAALLAETGMLDGLSATTHWEAIDWLRDAYPAVHVVADQRIVDQGMIISSAGVSAGIDMALHVVARQYGDGVALETARDMEYDGYRPVAS